LDKVSKAQLTTTQAWLAYKCCYVPAMMYSLTAVNLSEKQLTNLQRKATSKFTQVCGYEITFPKAVVHGPTSFGGLGFPHLYVESSVGKIEALMCHINKKTSLGQTMGLNLNWIQLHCGIDVPFLECKYPLDYVQTNWFTEIKRFLFKCNAEIIIKSLWVPELLRENDFFIMDNIHIQNTTKINRIVTNNWRLYFVVDCISEITNYCGDTNVSCVTCSS
jgi:hypothetical protein